MDKILLVLHYKQVAHRLKIFRGTPSVELEAFVKSQLQIDPADSLRFTDDDGDNTMLSSYCPTGTELHVTAEPPPMPPPQISSVTGTLQSFRRQRRGLDLVSAFASGSADSNTGQDDPNWRLWAKCLSASDGGSPGCISQDGAVWSAKSEDFGAVTFSKALPTSGQHYVAISLSHTPCCCSLGLVAGATMRLGHVDMRKVHPHMMQLMAFRQGGDPYSSSTAGCSPPFDKPFIAGIYIDMDARIVHYFSHEYGTNITRMDNLPPVVKIAIFHPKHGLQAEILTQTQVPSCAREVVNPKRARTVSKMFQEGTIWCNLTVPDLKQACRERSLAVSGAKADLVARLQNS